MTTIIDDNSGNNADVLSYYEGNMYMGIRYEQFPTSFPNGDSLTESQRDWQIRALRVKYPGVFGASQSAHEHAMRLLGRTNSDGFDLSESDDAPNVLQVTSGDGGVGTSEQRKKDIETTNAAIKYIEDHQLDEYKK